MSEYNKMVKDLTKPPENLLASMTPTSVGFMHAFVGIGDELLELHEALENNDHKNILEELGDALFYTEMLGMELGVSLDQFKTLMNNFSIEKPDEYSTLRKFASDAITYAKRVGIYNKSYDLDELNYFYVKVHMLLKSISTEFALDLPDAFNEMYPSVKVPETTLAIIQEANMQKLLKGDTARYKSGSYSDEQANARADKQ